MAKVDVRAEVASSVWVHTSAVGQVVSAGAQLLVLECMKMEIPVESPCAGTVTWLAAPASTVAAGDIVATITT